MRKLNHDRSGVAKNTRKLNARAQTRVGINSRLCANDTWIMHFAGEKQSPRYSARSIDFNRDVILVERFIQLSAYRINFRSLHLRGKTISGTSRISGFCVCVCEGVRLKWLTARFPPLNRASLPRF